MYNNINYNVFSTKQAKSTQKIIASDFIYDIIGVMKCRI
jgi:hypothetical protein